MSAPKKFVFRVCFEVEYSAEDIKAEFEKFANTSVADITKQLNELVNKDGLIDIDGDGDGDRATDIVNDFLEYTIDDAEEAEEKDKDTEKSEECEESEEEADCLF